MPYRGGAMTRGKLSAASDATGGLENADNGRDIAPRSKRPNGKGHGEMRGTRTRTRDGRQPRVGGPKSLQPTAHLTARGFVHVVAG
jgi:hypothetical protein